MGAMSTPIDAASGTSGDLLATDRTKVRRASERGSFDRELAYSIIDEALVAHVGFVVDGRPRVLPMTYGRIDDQLYLHGAVGNAMLRASAGAQVSATITLLDGLVLARSAFHHSMNYRCVVLFGEAVKVDDPSEKLRAFDAVVDHMVPGRSREVRPSNAHELRTTLVLRLPIAEGSVKVRGHGVGDDPADSDVPAWAGVVPTALVAATPVQDPAQTVDGLAPPSPDRLAR